MFFPVWHSSSIPAAKRTTVPQGLAVETNFSSLPLLSCLRCCRKVGRDLETSAWLLKVSKRGTLSQLSTAQGEGVEKERAGEGHLECQEG